MALNTLDIYVVKPKEAYNLVTNPSIELATTGYNAVSSAIARVKDFQRRGSYSLEVTPSTGVVAGVYYGTVSLVSGKSYTFSVDVKGVSGQMMSVEFRDTSGNLLDKYTFAANGYWQRVSVTRAEVSSTTRRVYIMREAVASTAKFYVDGLQVEEGSESTYFDGDIKGYTRNRVDFRWVGVPHGSQSWRSAATRKGGELVKLSTLCNILGIIGLGMASVNPQAVDTTLPGSVYQRTSVDDRDFSIPVKFSGENLAEVMQKRKAVIDLVRPDAGDDDDDQPITLVVDTLDENGSQVAERSLIAAHYVGGMGMKITENQRTEKTSLNFRSYLPFVSADGSRAVELSVSTALTANSMIRRRSNGAWENAGQTATINSGYTATVTRGPDGYIYFGGIFQNFNGVSAMDHIGRWDGSAFSALGSGLSGTEPQHGLSQMAFGPDGKLYVVGEWLSAGGVANTANIAAWNGAAWESVAVVDGRVNGLAFTADGSLFIFGTFTTVAGVSCEKIAKRSPAGTWGNVGAGVTGVGEYIQTMTAVGNDIYIGGNLSIISGVTVYDIAKYSGTTWTSVGTGTQGSSVPPLSVNTAVSHIVHDPRTGRLYIGGPFDKFNGVTVEGVGYWTGTAFIPMATNLGTGTAWDGNKKFYLDDNGGVYVWGMWGGGVYPSALGYYRGGVWVSTPIKFSGSETITSIFVDTHNEELYVSLSKNTNFTVYVNSSAVDSLSTVRSSPVFTITGPGSLWEIENRATRQKITFSGLTLASGEILTLDLTPGQISFTSNFRGNMLAYIVPGSNLGFYLRAGVNYVSTFMTGTTSASKIMMYWQDSYWSLDGAIR